jgi:hypothetical protein
LPVPLAQTKRSVALSLPLPRSLSFPRVTSAREIGPPPRWPRPESAVRGTVIDILV